MSISDKAAPVAELHSHRQPSASQFLGGQIWIQIVLAALAMVATLPGRTHGLGLVTEPLLTDLQLDRVTFAEINLWATLLGGLFCLPCGWLIDRLGTLTVLVFVVAGLGGVVVYMSTIPAGWGIVEVPTFIASGSAQMMLGLFVLILLTRGLGQSALSVLSLTLMGKAAGKHGGLAFGLYSFVVAVGFMAAFRWVKYVLEVHEVGWRTLWAGIGYAVMAFVVPAVLFLRSPARSERNHRDERAAEDRDEGRTLREAVKTSTFWIFGATTSLYGAIAAGISLFNQSILAEREFDRSLFLNITAISPLVGLASNLLTGFLSTWISMGRLLCVSMIVLAAAMSLFPQVTTETQVYSYAVAMGAVGGMVTVIFFAIWNQAFGSAHLGKIQGAAQMLTVLASAVGPLLLATSKERLGSYVPLFYGFAAVSAVLGVAAWFTPAHNKA